MFETLTVFPLQESVVPMSFVGALPLVERGVVRAGISRYAGGIAIPAERASYIAFVYTVSGNAEAAVNGERYPLAPDTLWIAPAGTSYAIATGDEPWETMWLELRPVSLWRHIDEPHFRYAGQAARMVHVMSGLIGEANSPRQDSAQMARCFAEILAIFVDRRLHRGDEITDEDMRQRLGAMWERVSTDVAHPWSVAEMAALVSVSPSHLYRVVQQAQGTTPAGFLAQLRMQRAQDLLAHTAYKLDYIAHRVGYESAYALSKAFKRLVGISPKAYRRDQAVFLGPEPPV